GFKCRSSFHHRDTEITELSVAPLRVLCASAVSIGASTKEVAGWVAYQLLPRAQIAVGREATDQHKRPPVGFAHNDLGGRGGLIGGGNLRGPKLVAVGIALPNVRAHRVQSSDAKRDVRRACAP